MNDWLDFDIDKTIRDFDYTKRAVANMDAVISSEDFESMDSEMIFKYLSEQMNVVLFPDYLKRYIYGKVDIEAVFSEVTDRVYADIISSSFEYNEAPYSFVPTTTKRNTVIKGWLGSATVKRDSIFVLGFGLKMSADDVSEFLTKVIQEEDFDFTDPKEVIFWFCFNNSLPYVRAKHMIKTYDELEPEKGSDSKWQAMASDPKMFLMSESNLTAYLKMLKYRGISESRREAAYVEFLKLYDRCRQIIADMYNMDAEFIDGGKKYNIKEISAYEVEKTLCSGIPVNKSGNLQKMSASRFNALFKTKRMSRQRINSILNKVHRVERFDLITLLFFIYAQTVEPDWPAERYLKYIDDVNEILKKCSMHGIYPVNPYEAFVLMCLVTDYPLDVYAEIWSRSFEE